MQISPRSFPSWCTCFVNLSSIFLSFAKRTQAGAELLSRSCTPMGWAGPSVPERDLGGGEGPDRGWEEWEGPTGHRAPMDLTFTARRRPRESFYPPSALRT